MKNDKTKRFKSTEEKHKCLQMPIFELIKIRYKKILEALYENAPIKAMLSILAAIASTALDLFNMIGDIFQTPPELVLLLLVAILVDWVTGIKSARRNGIFIRSLGFRQTVVKILEYGGFLLILTGIGNVFGNTGIEGWVASLFHYLGNVHWFGYFYITFTELKSIGENIQDKEGRFAKIIRYINEKIFGEINDDDAR